MVKCELTDNKLILSPASSDNNVVLLTHPSFCPILQLSSDDQLNLPPDIQTRGINVGVVNILETRDQHLLFTRRAKHMRTFPGVWVPPGGHIDWGEGLLEAAVRELQEETGLVVQPDNWYVLCLWESVFPPMLGRGQPKRHHIVVYLHLRVKQDHEELDRMMRLDTSEVDAAMWLSREQVATMVEGEGGGAGGNVRMSVVGSEGVRKSEELPVSVLSAGAPLEGCDVERVSTGTRYACQQWLKKCSQKH